MSATRTDDPEVLRAVLDNLPTGVYLVDCHGKILLWNSAAERITGYLRQDLIGRSAHEGFLSYSDGNDNEIGADIAPLSMVLREGQPAGSVVNLRHKQGHRVPVRLYAAPIRNSHGSIIGAVESFEEKSSSADWVDRHSKLEQYGCIDGTSGVLSHDMIQVHLRENLAMFADKPVSFSIVCVAIDHLEEIRRRQGPAVIPPLLRMVGLTLENSLRPTDFLGRWRDNEFLAILTECGAEGMRASAERLRRMIGEVEMEWWGDTLKFSVSLGAATARSGDDLESILGRAEAALLQSTQAGGNRITVTPDEQ